MQGSSFVLSENSPFLRSTESNRKWWTEKDMRAKELGDKTDVDTIIENGNVLLSIQTFTVSFLGDSRWRADLDFP